MVQILFFFFSFVYFFAIFQGNKFCFYVVEILLFWKSWFLYKSCFSLDRSYFVVLRKLSDKSLSNLTGHFKTFQTQMAKKFCQTTIFFLLILLIASQNTISNSILMCRPALVISIMLVMFILPYFDIPLTRNLKTEICTMIQYPWWT